jgi:hypothetical protein
MYGGALFARAVITSPSNIIHFDDNHASVEYNDIMSVPDEVRLTLKQSEG